MIGYVFGVLKANARKFERDKVLIIGQFNRACIPCVGVDGKPLQPLHIYFGEVYRRGNSIFMNIAGHPFQHAFVCAHIKYIAVFQDAIGFPVYIVIIYPDVPYQRLYEIAGYYIDAVVGCQVNGAALIKKNVAYPVGIQAVLCADMREWLIRNRGEYKHSVGTRAKQNISASIACTAPDVQVRETRRGTEFL